MHDHAEKKIAIKSDNPKLLLVGNPNVGKSAIFGLLTGRYVVVSNYPGTTVEVTRGEIAMHRAKFMLVDTPGVNSLVPMSEDEKVTRDILLEEKPEAVINVVDAKNIKRALFLTLQLVEMGVPLVIDLNMTDEALNRGIAIDEGKLGSIFGLEVVSTIAVQKKGMTALKKASARAVRSKYSFSYDADIESCIAKVEALLPEASISKRSIAIMILSGDKTLKTWLLANVSKENVNRLESLRDALTERYAAPVSYIISQQRLKVVDGIAAEVMSKTEEARGGITKFIAEVTTHPVWGVPFLLLVIYGMYVFVGRFGAGFMVDYIEDVIFGAYLNPWAEKIVMNLVPVTLLQELLIGPYGIITMALTYAIAIVLPITATFFIAFSIMEDSGYLPRLAAMLNRMFQTMGLNGKAVLPMVLGLGCGTMATLTTRILDTKKERIIVTLLLALGIPCSAQLGVILGMFGKQPFSAMLIWILMLMAVILFVGFLAARIIPGQRTDFILELPPIRIPQFSNVFLKTLSRIEWYLKEAVPLFVLGTFILFVADKLKIIPFLEKAASPIIVTVLGLPSQATASFIMGFLRRDYGAAGLFKLSEQGLLNTEQVVVSLVTITLFIPCIANFFMIVKERGMKMALAMAFFIFPFAVLIGGLLHRLLTGLHIFG